MRKVPILYAYKVTRTPDPGYYAPTGSTEQTPCSPGTVATNASMGACAKCEAGKYQDTDGKTECKPCTVGSYCAEGAAAPLPCKAGTYQNETMLQLNLSMTSADDCLECPTGHRCVGGQSEPKLCGVGSFASIQGAAGCSECEAGSFQDEQGATMCKACSIAAYCAGEGVSSPTPCPGGTWSNRTGLSSKNECTKVVKGEWAPTGSTTAKQCPASGFYCPGYNADNVNEPPGSEPIIIDSGASRKTRKVT